MITHAQNSEPIKTKRIIDSLLNFNKITNREDTSKIQNLNEISRLYRIIGEDEKSLNYAHQAIEFSLKNTNQLLQAKSLNNLAVTQMMLSDYDNSYNNHIKALEIYTELKYQKGIASTLYNIGDLHYQKSDYSKSIEFFFKSLKIKEAINEQSGIANIYFRLGYIQCLLGNFEKALEYNYKSLSIREQQGNKSEIAHSYNGIGIILEERGNYTKALENYLEALNIYKNNNDNEGVANSHNNIGNAYLKLGDQYASKNLNANYYYKKALSNYEKALAIHETFKFSEAIAGTKLNISSIFIKTNRLDEATYYLDEALVTFQKIKNKSGIQECYSLMSKLAEKQGDCAKELLYFKLFSKMKDSILNEKSNHQIVEMGTKYETAKKDKNIEILTKDKALQESELSKQKLLRNGVIGGLIIVLLIVFILYSRYITKQKLNNILNNKNNELVDKNVLIEKQKEKIVDSINYAHLIQQSVLNTEEDFQSLLPDAFLFYKPKDIVSGDFYWCNQIKNKIIVAAIDCTGHGVPGAFMSIIGNTLLNQIIIEKEITNPAEILKSLHLGVFETLHQAKDGTLSRDGMDAAICAIDFENKRVEYAGAQNPLYITIGNELKIITADKKTIGGNHYSKANQTNEIVFTNHIIPIENDMRIFMFSDGYMDQFGGGNKKKYGTNQFKEFILSNHLLSIQELGSQIIEEHNRWKGNYNQIDDILVIGIKVG